MNLITCRLLKCQITKPEVPITMAALDIETYTSYEAFTADWGLRTKRYE